jgi:hypothetical protein
MYHPVHAGEQIDAEHLTATKADGALAHTDIWNVRIWRKWTQAKVKAEVYVLEHGQDPLDTLRAWLLRMWRRNVLASYRTYMLKEYGSAWSCPRDCNRSDLIVGRSCIRHVANASWWEWDGGSTLLFWRWPKELRGAARDGLPVWIKGELPNYRRPQRKEPDENQLTQVAEKLNNVRMKGYIQDGAVTSLTSFFAVPKGQTDIRMVYDATKSGLNRAIWVPSFALPSLDSLTDLLSWESWMSDQDLGEMFLNFPLNTQLRPYCGIDLRPYLDPTNSRGKTWWEVWVRCMMGLMSSPYICTKMIALANEMIKGCHQDSTNPFQWHQVILNLPGDPNYCPQLPWVHRSRQDGSLASDVVAYVGDIRPTGPTEERCWETGHRLACLYSWLGIQVSSRKTRPPSQTPGAWAGSIVRTGPAGIGVQCALDKWRKAKQLLEDIQTEISTTGALIHKDLEKKRGFFVHLQRTYPCLTPFLKGMHLTLDSWRPNRTQEGWPQPSFSAEQGYWDDAIGQWVCCEVTSDKPPVSVSPVPCLLSDLQCLARLFTPEVPPIRYIRSTKMQVAAYGFVDASGAGFGASIQLPNGVTTFRHGIWGHDMDHHSSNFRELRNLVDTIQESLGAGELVDTELFIVTDNIVAESAYCKGNSPNPVLFELCLRLRCMEMEGSLKLHVLHASGTRMIRQGTDGLSRGDFSMGVMAGAPMLEFLPLHLSAFDRHPSLLTWVQSWLPHPVRPLTPAEWYTLGQGVAGGSYTAGGLWIPQPALETWHLWAPPPGAASAAVDLLTLSRHKRTHLNHVFICPRLLTSHWWKKLSKVSDLVLELPAQPNTAWPPAMHEPVIIGLTLRFIHHSPWQLRNTGKVLDMGREVSRLWKGAQVDAGPVLRKLCILPDVLDPLPGGVVWNMLRSPPPGSLLQVSAE